MRRLPRLRLLFLTTAIVTAAWASANGQAPPRLDPLDATGRVTYFITEGEPGSAYEADDPELARWALAAWERNSGGTLRFVPGDEETALIRVHWVPAGGGQYGEMTSFVTNGRRGAAVYIRPDTNGLGPDIARLARQDRLLRDTIVYLTCLHELGHALGLGHTDQFADIMYAFGYGGDIPSFFGRYRAQIQKRTDIQKVAGLSNADVRTLMTLYEH